MPDTSTGFKPPVRTYRPDIVKNYYFLETQPELVFKNIVRLASQMFDVPLVFISLIDKDRIFFKANHGIGTISNITSNKKFCALIDKYKEAPAYMHQFSEKVVIEDSDAEDPYDIHFYATVPLVNREGFIIGNVCLADTRLRRFSPNEKVQLEQVASVVMDEIELRKSTVEATQKLLAINRSLKETIIKPKYLVLDAPAALGVLSGRELVIESANNKLLNIWGKEVTVIGKPLSDVRSGLEARPFLKILDNVFTSGEPYFGNEVFTRCIIDNVKQPGYFNFVYHPLKNEAGKVIGIFIIGVEITNEIECRKKVEQVESILRMATDAGGIGTWYIDVETREFIPSRRLKEIFGYEENEEMLCETSLSQVADAYRKPLIVAMEACISGGEKFDVEFPFSSRKNNKKKWVKAMGRLYASSENLQTHFSGTVIDITETKKNEQLKNDFISIVSHDLKTPLTSLKGCIQLLKESSAGIKDKFQRTVMSRADKMVVKMTEMIDGYLDVKRLQEGKMYMHISTINIHQVISSAVDQVKSSGVSREFNITCSRSLTCTGDKIKIEQVIQNLLSNALKYSYENSAININCNSKDGYINFNIQDYGQGILQKNLSKLFGRFYRGEAENTSMAGFGVGLYICSEIIHSHKGSIWAESEPGKGSVFYFQIPKMYI